ncbi:MAG: trypsin-like peptidase domain-containing protein [bacterium]
MRVTFYSLLACLLGVGIAAGLGWTGTSHVMPVIDTEAQIPAQAVQPALDLSDAFVKVSETVTPAVVRIEARRQRPGASSARSRNRLFGPDDNPGQTPDRVAGGSGFIISDDGYILTNNHVVADANSLTVFLQDRRSFPATVVGRDPFTDVAVIKIDAPNLRKLSFGSSSELRVGEWIVAIGNPGFGGTSRPLDYTVTVGIVSAIGRPLQLLQRELAQDEETRNNQGFAIEDFIQTDAVINPGNSGGPMVNLRGQVVGINSAIASRTGFYQGYGFAIPIDLAHRVMEDLVEYGRVRRAWLGVAMRPIDQISAEAYGLPTVTGVELTLITVGGPAQAQGLRLYDVLVEVDEQPIGRVGQLQQTIAMRRPGDRIDVKVYRDGRPLTVEIRLGEAPLQREPVVAVTEPAREERMDDKLGLRIEDMTRQNAAEFGYDDIEGPVITDVQVNGPAARRGLTPGWRVLEINRQVVEDAEDVRRIMSRVGRGDIVTLHLAAPNATRQIVHVKVPD